MSGAYRHATIVRIVSIAYRQYCNNVNANSLLTAVVTVLIAYRQYIAIVTVLIAYWVVQAGLLTPLTFAWHCLSPLAAFTSVAYFLHSGRW